MLRPISRWFRWLPGLILFLPLAARTLESPPAIRANPISQRIVIDGRLDEAAWNTGVSIPSLTQQEPSPGVATPFDGTRVTILTDGERLYVGVVCPDPAPERVAIHTLQRDAEQEGDDSIALVFDTFGDHRTGYLFRVNAGGARQDGLISGKDGVSLDWDGIWEARTRRDASGWTAEILISVRSLRFGRGLDGWGFNVERTVARERLTLRWASASLDSGLADLQRAGTLSGLARLRQGLGLSVAPYALGRIDETSRTGVRQDGDLGLDLSYNLTPSLGAVVTVNTDFAETEVDSRQVNLTRFPLFFPEKRPFFLEGSNLFEFGSELAPDLIPFYSRRIGLAEGRAIPIDLGAKVLGRQDRWGFAFLGVETGSDGREARAHPLLAARTTFDVDDHLRLGALGTRGTPSGAGDNTFGGLDALWQTSSFRGDKNLTLAAWAARSTGDRPSGRTHGDRSRDDTGWGVRAFYPNDLWDLSFSLDSYGEALDPALGFLPRPGTRKWAWGTAYQPRPSAEGPFGWVRQFFFELFVTRVDRLGGATESWRVFTAPWNVETKSGEHLEANWAPQFERLSEPFEIASGVVIPPGDYRFDRYRVEAQSASSRPWRVGSTVWFGDFFGGRLTQWESFVYRTFGAGTLRVELDAENDFGSLPQGDFVQRLLQAKTFYSFSPDLLASAFVQYDSESRDLGLNARLHWTFQPGRDLFVVWNRNWKRALSESDRFTRESDRLVVKLRWSQLW